MQSDFFFFVFFGYIFFFFLLNQRVPGITFTGLAQRYIKNDPFISHYPLFIPFLERFSRANFLASLPIQEFRLLTQ